MSADGKLWFGTWVNGLVSLFDGERWATFGPAQGLSSGGYVWAVAAGQGGTAWAGTSNGLGYFDGSAWRMQSSFGGAAVDDVRSVTITADQTTWIGTYDYQQGGQVAMFREGVWRVFGEADGLTPGEGVWSLAARPDGTVYAGTTNGLYRFDGIRWMLVAGSPRYVNDIAFAQDDSLWVATEFDGVSRHDGMAWQDNYRLGDGLPGLRMNTVAIAPDGALWVGGDGGASRLIVRR
ncbi:MAG: hypothetical protein IT317_08325 [Anaerolineales bacterium]|nr:hypothetical protein [Anaerolineales bacterium]